MKKKLVALVLCFLCTSVFCRVAYADSGVSYVDDNAGLLSTAERNNLIAKAEYLSDIYQEEIRILTIDSLGNFYAEEYADWYYYSNDFAEDGILLLIAMNEREWYIYTSGDMIYRFTDNDIQNLGSTFTQYLANGENYRAFERYLDALPYYIEGKQDEPDFMLSLVIGIIAGGVAVWGMSASMNTKRKQSTASYYMENNSFRLHTHQDLFLYSKVDKVRREQNNNSSGGKTTVHRSSSGRSHGGGGGKF